MNLLGRGLENMVQEISTKYDFSFPVETITVEVNRLTNQLWKLIPMRENEEDYQKQINTVIIDIAGLNEVFLENPLYLQLLSKLEGLLVLDINFELYRKTVFECISLIQEVKHGLT